MVFIQSIVMKDMNKLNKIYSDIKEMKIRGATNIAEAAVTAYSIKPTSENRKKLISLRPTEPTLANALNFVDKIGESNVLAHFSYSQEKINQLLVKMIKKGMIIYTHCYSTNVVKALVYARKKGKKFEVYNTETRPMMQGRATAKALAGAGIKVTSWVDAAMDDAIEGADLILIGADAILKSGAINKIGSEAIAEIAYLRKKPLYIVADSWKFSPRNVKIEERSFHEVWNKAPKNVRIRNPAFEKVDKKYIKGVISELGVLSFNEFIKKADKIL